MIALPDVSIQAQIYESATSRVYRGIRVQDGRSIILKLLKQDYPSPQELTRYRQEYAITRFLDVSGVIKAYNQLEYQRTLIILLEDFGGESLEYWKQQYSSFYPMSLSSFLRLAIDITDILGRIHAAGVIHKDINPGNIVLNLNTGVVKVIDFGIATQFNRTNPTVKSPYVLEGTLAYLSPEQTGRMNRVLDYRTDFYSLGVTFYELLTGQLPFPTTDIYELIHCHLAKSPVPPHKLNTAIPKTISDIVLKLMAKNAEDRYQSVWGIKADLEWCAEQLAARGQISDIQLGLQDISDQFQIPQKLYGREVEIAALLAAFERVAGRENAEIGRLGNPESNNVSTSPHPRIPVSSEMMLVSGYSGVGKSALVQELCKPITAKRGYFISGKFDQFQRNIPYSAIADALKKLVQQLLGEPDDRVQRWRARLLTALGSNGQLMINVIPEVELIIGQQPPLPEVGSTEAQNRFNLVFQQFIRVFCSKQHPLVIFLDDLQWIDSATLKLIELMLLDEQTQFLFLIGAYRDNEVSPTHPLVLTLESLRKQGAVLHQIVLSPLTLEPLSKLIAEAIHRETYTVLSLAELVLRKTGGNPFLVCEVLRLLYSENLLRFDVDRLSWQWSLDQIRALNITDTVNVVELLLNKLKKLPEVSQQLLQLAACIGAEFDLETLVIVCNQSPKTVFQGLLTAIQSGVVQPLSKLDKDLLVQDYKFLHDRIQQAAYTLIDESRKQVIHLQIGRNLLEKILPEKLSERLFEIVDHLNHGVELVTDQDERNKIARLNLVAGQKAKGAIAYRVAKNYLAIGRAWLEASSWKTDYDLTLEFALETTEVAYLCGDFEQVEFWLAIVLKEAKTILDSVKVYEVKIQTDIAQGQPLKAINTALQVLQQLGISFPKTPNRADITLELNAVLSRFNRQPIQDLFHLPKMAEPQPLAAMQILSRITLVAYHVAADLAPLLVLKQVNLSVQYGNMSVSPFAYANFGLVLCETAEDIEAGYQFGQLALRLLSHLKADSLKARTSFIVTNFITHWKKHIRDTSKPFLEAYQSGLETGDLEFAAYAAFTYSLQSFFAGEELVAVEREMATYGEAICQINQTASFIWIQIFRQSILNLMGRSLHPLRLVGESYNEETRPAHHETDGVILFLVHLNKLILCYLFSEYTQAFENAIVAERYIVRVAATPHVPLVYFYGMLARLAMYSESDAQVQQEILKEIAVSQEKIWQWAHHAPMNYLHKYYLVEAEKARVLGQLLEAEEFYEQAIQGARENGYIQEEALAYELAAKFYLGRGREKIAQLYMKEAHYCYERWGATAKVKDLETRYPLFLSQSSGMSGPSIRTPSGTTSNPSQVVFDLATVMKAAQAISSEIELEQLLSSLMHILIENAGAQTGCLLLEDSGEWKIDVACELVEGKHVCTNQVLQSTPITNCLPESIIQYVVRTHEAVILNDATREGHFIHDPYIQNHRTQSLLCLPLLNQSNLVGVLYLENQLAAGAFTPDRSQVLNLLSTQAAIAIENAKLYSKLRASESRMAQFLEAVPVGIAVFDAAGCPYYFNQRAIQLLGKEGDPSVSPDQLAAVYQVYLAGTDQPYPIEALPSIRALSGERSTVDDIEIHQNDKTIPVEVWGTPVFDEQGNVSYAIAAFQDITRRKQAEQVLADYNCTLEQQVTERTTDLLRERKRAEEASLLEERNRMAREIHDTLAQSFTGIIIHARSVASKIAIDPGKAQAYLAEVQDLARTGLTEARRSVEALRRPSVLENNDLLGAFKQLITQLESPTDTTLICEAIGTPYPLHSEVENNLLRIGQEALTNALRYAEATEICVELIYQPTQCILRIKDDGQGFTVDPASSRNGFGLLGMTERAKRIDAQIQIHSTLGQGTEIVVSVDQGKTS